VGVSVDDATVGRYRLVRRLGRGATGEVYEAVDGDRAVALKLLYPHYAGDATNRSRFDRELEVVRGLDHPNIVRPLDTGWDERRETLFLVMELLEGATLADELSQEPPASRRALVQHVLEALDGLAAAHAAGVVHRDIKPENVFIDQKLEPPRARIIDFGLAKHVASDHLTLTEFALGTPTYMAPEQATRARDASFAADVWSVGVLLYRIAAGFVPFEGEGPYDVLLKSTMQPPPPLVGVPAPMARLIGACLQKDAERRPASAGELKVSLQEAMADSEVDVWLESPSAPVENGVDATLTALGTPSSRQGIDASPPDRAPPSGSERPEAPRSRWRMYEVAGLVLGLGLAGLVTGGVLGEMTASTPVELAKPPPTFEARYRSQRLRVEPRPTQLEDADRPAPPPARGPARPGAAGASASPADEIENETRASPKSEEAAESPPPDTAWPLDASDSESSRAPSEEDERGGTQPSVASPQPNPDAQPPAEPAPTPTPEPTEEADEPTDEQEKKKIRPEELLTF
jgi:serine/threonine-protein kinase